MSRTAVIRLHSLGDVVLAQPVASELSKNTDVYFVTSKEYEPVVFRMPGNIHPLSTGGNTGPFELRKLVGKVSPDAVFDLQNNLTSRIASAGKPLIGRFRMDRKRRRQVLLHKAESMPLRTGDFMTSAGLDPDTDPILENGNITHSDNLRIGIVTGGRWYLKSIPVGVVSETSRILSDIHGADILLLGAEEETELLKRTAELIGRNGIETYHGEDGVKGLIEMIENLDLLISPDSGPAHLASALGIPVLVVFTSTSPSLGFWKTGRKGNFMVDGLTCRPCHRHGGNSCPNGTELCRKGILPFRLAERAMEMLET